MQGQIVGHHIQRQLLERLFRQGKLPSTILLAGPSGIGKSLVARELARTLVCDKNRGTQPRSKEASYGGCPSDARCHSCSVFDAHNHPDLDWVSVGDKDLSSVESCRQLLYSLHLAPLSAGVRVVVFDRAELLTLAISNTLLKILEEPPANTYFILVASNSSRLPATLLSRCQIWFFDALSSAQVREVLQQDKSLAPEQLDSLAMIADGSLDSLDQIRSHIGEWQTLCERIDSIIAGSRAEAALLASELGRNKTELPSTLRLIRIYARQRLIQHAHEGSSRREISSRISVFLTNLIAAEYFLFERNLAPTPVLSTMFDALAGKSYAAFTCMTNGATVLQDIAV